MTIIYVGIGIVIGTFIPMPQQAIVRALASKLWNWVRGTVSGD